MMPERTKQAIDRYVNDHMPVGHFLTAVLMNNLSISITYADEENRAALLDIVKYCWNKIPGNCWGSPEAVKAWLAARIPTAAVSLPEG